MGGFNWSEIDKCWKAAKRLDRSAPNFAHMRIHLGINIFKYFLYNNIQKIFSQLTPKGGILGVYGVKKQISWKAAKQLDRLTPNLAHVHRFNWKWTLAIKKKGRRDSLGAF